MFNSFNRRGKGMSIKGTILTALVATYLYAPISMSAEWSCEQHYKNISTSESETGLKFTRDIAWRELLGDMEREYNDGDKTLYDRAKSLYDKFGLTHQNSANGRSCKENKQKNNRVFNFVSSIHNKIEEKIQEHQIEEKRKLAELDKVRNSGSLKQYREDINKQKVQGYKDIKFGMTKEEVNQIEASKGVVLFGKKRKIEVFYRKDPDSGVRIVSFTKIYFDDFSMSFDMTKDIFDPDKVKALYEGISDSNNKKFVLFYENLTSLLSKKYDICYQPTQVEKKNFLMINKGSVDTAAKQIYWCLESGSVLVLATRSSAYGKLAGQRVSLFYNDHIEARELLEFVESKKAKREKDRLERLEQERIKNKKTTADDF